MSDLNDGFGSTLESGPVGFTEQSQLRPWIGRLPEQDDFEITAGIEEEEPRPAPRLVDLDPKSSAETPLTWAESVRRLKASLRHDLEWLLNTRRIPLELPESFVEVPESLFYYGFPDITSMSRDSRDSRIRLHGPSSLVRAFPTWNARSSFAHIKPVSPRLVRTA